MSHARDLLAAQRRAGLTYSRRGFLRMGGALALSFAAGSMRLPVQAGTRRRVPFHVQEHLLSCEVACLRMTAGYYGLELAEQELLDLLRFEETRLELDDRNRVIWGDPNKGFVGNLDGWQLYDRGLQVHPPQRRNVWWWGYGVHSKPLADLATRLGLFTQRLADLSDVYWHLDHGHPVIVYVPSGGLTEVVRWSWFTKDGDEVPVINREHAVVLNPGYDAERVYVNDPYRAYWDRVHDYTHEDLALAFGGLSMALAVCGLKRTLPKLRRHLSR
jgi:uncharacterized protein YvpB